MCQSGSNWQFVGSSGESTRARGWFVAHIFRLSEAMPVCRRAGWHMRQLCESQLGTVLV
jgi:hypothetical protein